MSADELRTEMEKLAAQCEALEALCRALDLDPLTARVPELAGKPEEETLFGRMIAE